MEVFMLLAMFLQSLIPVCLICHPSIYIYIYIYTVLLCANSLFHQSHRQTLEVYLKCLKRKERSMQSAIPVFDYLRISGLS